MAKLYVTVDDNGIIYGWQGTQADARAHKKEVGAAEWREFEVPTNKEDLLAFLNKYAVGCSAEEGVVFVEPEAETDDLPFEPDPEPEPEPTPAPKKGKGRR